MNFLFDIGRVLLDFDFQASLRRLLPEQIDNPQAHLDAILAEGKRFELGELSSQQFLAWALPKLPVSITEEQFIHAWRDIFTPNEPMWQTARTLQAQGHRLILFSNTNSLHCPYIFERWPEFEELFAGKVLSYEVGSMKPEEGMYHHAIQEFALTPTETRYIDDLPANIETGQRLGFQCWTYELNAHQAFLDWLSQQGIHLS